MVLRPVVSSQILAVGYDHTGRTLAVEFKPGKNGRSIYTYPNVEPETAAAIVFAESVGKAFGELVRSNPKHPFVKPSDVSVFEIAGPEEELIWVELLKGHRRAS